MKTAHLCSMHHLSLWLLQGDLVIMLLFFFFSPSPAVPAEGRLSQGWRPLWCRAEDVVRYWQNTPNPHPLPPTHWAKWPVWARSHSGGESVWSRITHQPRLHMCLKWPFCHCCCCCCCYCCFSPPTRKLCVVCWRSTCMLMGSARGFVSIFLWLIPKFSI